MVAEVTFGEESANALIDLVNKHRIELHSKLLSSLLFFGQDLHALADSLVVVNMLNAVDEIANIKLFLEPKMQPLSLVLELDIDIDLTLQDCMKHCINSREIARLHCLSQLRLAIYNHLVALFAPADHLFLRLAFHVFKDPVPQTAALAEELVAFLAIVLRILEGKLAFAALVPLAIRLVATLLD